jgi:hypothetical protein
MRNGGVGFSMVRRADYLVGPGAPRAPPNCDPGSTGERVLRLRFCGLHADVVPPGASDGSPLSSVCRPGCARGAMASSTATSAADTSSTDKQQLTQNLLRRLRDLGVVVEVKASKTCQLSRCTASPGSSFSLALQHQ